MESTAIMKIDEVYRRASLPAQPSQNADKSSTEKLEDALLSLNI